MPLKTVCGSYFLLLVVRVSVAIFPKVAQQLLLLCCRIHREKASGQMHDYKEENVKISTSTQQREILYTDSHDMLVQSSVV
jgi:hypothetical protein